MAALFAASLSQPRPAEIVGEKIREIIESGTTVLRHPVGPDAARFLAWRAAMTDEQWIRWNSQGEAEWLASVKADFGMELTLS